MAISQATLRTYSRFAIWLELIGVSLLYLGYLADQFIFSRFYAGLPVFFGYDSFRILGIPYWLFSLVILVGVNVLTARKNKEIIARFADGAWSHIYPGPRMVLVSLATILVLIGLFPILEIFV
jgi:hypothetical protein